jgi:hypothetical protein
LKENKEKISRFFAVVLLLAIAAAPQASLVGQKISEGRNINVNEALNLNALGINNEVRRIGSLPEAQAKFFKRATVLQKNTIVSPRDATDFKNEGDLRKADLATLQREFESLINKLKQGNHWDETFDAQVLASLKSDNARTVLTQFGGARKVFQAAVDTGPADLRDDIDDEVRQVNSKQQGALRHRSDRVFAAHAKAPVVKVGCNLLLSYWMAASLIPGGASLACVFAERYNNKGCTPRLNVDC